MLDTTKFYSLIPAWMTLMFAQGHRKARTCVVILLLSCMKQLKCSWWLIMKGRWLWESWLLGRWLWISSLRWIWIIWAFAVLVWSPLSFRWSVLWCSDLSLFRKFLKPLSTSASPSWRPALTFSTLLASWFCTVKLLSELCPMSVSFESQSLGH